MISGKSEKPWLIYLLLQSYYLQVFISLFEYYTYTEIYMNKHI